MLFINRVEEDNRASHKLMQLDLQLLHHPAGLCDLYSSKSLVGYTYATTRHEEIFDIGESKSNVWNGVAIRTIHTLSVHRVGDKR